MKLAQTRRPPSAGRPNSETHTNMTTTETNHARSIVELKFDYIKYFICIFIYLYFFKYLK